MLELMNEILHSQDTTNISGIVTEKESSEGSEHAHQVGLHSDRRLDAGRIRRGENSSPRHDDGCLEIEGLGKEFKATLSFVLKDLEEI